MPVAWDDDPVVAAWPGLPPLAGDVSADACVVGLGASGLAAVEALTDRGLTVVGVDAGRVGCAAAGRNGGFLLGGPAPFLHEAITRWGEEPAVALYRATLAELDAVAARLGPAVVRRAGSIRLAGLPGEPDGNELADCDRLAAAMRAHGFAVEQYDGELGRGLFVPGDAAVNPARRVIGTARELSGRATLYEHTHVRRIAAGRVDTEHGSVAAPVIVVAVDGRLDTLLPSLAGRVRTARLQMLATAPLRPRVPCPLYCRWGYDYAQQLPTGELAVGGGRDRFADDEWTRESGPTPQVQGWIEQVARRIAAAPVTVTHRWAAPVGFTADGKPLCVRVDDGVVAAGGYSGTGNLVGPVVARAAVALALDGTPPPTFCAT